MRNVRDDLVEVAARQRKRASIQAQAQRARRSAAAAAVIRAAADGGAAEADPTVGVGERQRKAAAAADAKAADAAEELDLALATGGNLSPPPLKQTTQRAEAAPASSSVSASTNDGTTGTEFARAMVGVVELSLADVYTHVVAASTGLGTNATGGTSGASAPLDVLVRVPLTNTMTGIANTTQPQHDAGRAADYSG